MTRFPQYTEDSYFGLFAGPNYILNQARHALESDTVPVFLNDLQVYADQLDTYARRNRNRSFVSTLEAIEHLVLLADPRTSARANLETVRNHFQHQDVWTGCLSAPQRHGALPEQEPAIRQAQRLRVDSSVDLLIGVYLQYLAGTLPRPSPSFTVPILFDTDMQDGTKSLGALTVARIKNGPPGLYPDPASMAFASTDHAFSLALCNAHALKASPSACILWAVKAAARRDVTLLEGGSIGAAAGLAFEEIGRASRHLGRFRYRRSSSSFVLSASIDADGRLFKVSGLAEKVSAAAHVNKTLVVSDEDADSAQRLAVQLQTTVLHRPNLDKAAATTRRVNPLLAFTVAAVMIVGIALSGVIFSGVESRRDAHLAAIRSKIDSLTSILENSDSQAPNYHTKALIQLTAASLAQGIDDDALVQEILDHEIVTGDSSPDELIDPGIGIIRNLHQVGRNILAASINGKIALLDPNERSKIGDYTEGAGVQNLGQSTASTTAINPRANMLAVVFQNTVQVAGVSHKADVRIFDTTSGLRLIGGAENVTAKPVLASAINKSGDTLLLAAEGELDSLDVTTSDPQRLGQCTLPAELRPIQIVTDPLTDQPVIISSDGSANLVRSWRSEAGEGGECSVEQRLASATDVAEPGSYRSETVAATLGSAPNSDIESITVWYVQSGTGQVVGRTINGSSSSVLPVDGATAVSSSGDGILLVSTGGELSQLTTFNVVDVGSPEQLLQGKGDDDNASMAAFGEIFVVDPSTDALARYQEAMYFPAATFPLSQAAGFNTVSAGSSSFAVSYAGGGIGVFQSGPSSSARFIGTADGAAVATDTEYRPGASLSMSDDGTFVAAIVGPLSNSSDGKTYRELNVWNLGSPAGRVVDLPDSVVQKQNSHVRATAVRFERGSDRLVVSFADGSIFRVSGLGTDSPSATALNADPLIVTSGLESGPKGIYYAEKESPTSAATRVVRVSAGEKGPSDWQAWDIGGLAFKQPILAPLDDGGAVMLDIGGSAVLLRADGTLGGTFELRPTQVLGAEQVPGTQTVLIATSRLSQIVDVSTGIVTGDTRGNLYNFASLHDGSALLEVDFLDQLFLYQSLIPNTQRSLLCSAAGRDMTEAEWNFYVGEVEEYRPLCSQDPTSSVEELGQLMDVVRHARPDALLRTPSSLERDLLEPRCSTAANSAGEFSWDIPRTDSISASLFVCVSGGLAFVASGPATPNLYWGAVGGENIMVFAGTSAPYGGFGLDVVSGDRKLISFTSSADSVVSLKSDGVYISSTSGALRLETVFGPGPAGVWEPLTQRPIGRA